MPFTRHLLGATVAAAFLSWGGSAFAQSVAINEGSIQRSAVFRSSTQNPLWISKADCLANDTFYFPLTVTNAGAYQLEVWVGFAGTDCTALEARRQTTATCWKVWQGVPTSTGIQVPVRVQDIVSEDKDTPESVVSGTAEDCEPTDAVTEPQAIELYFMFVDSGSGTNSGGVKWATKMDLAGPVAPTDVSAGIGDTIIVMDWTQSTDTDRASYKFYCDPIPGKEGDQTNVTPLFADASIDINLDALDDVTTTTDADTDAAAADAGPDADPDADTDAAADADTDAAADAEAEAASVGNSACPTNILIEGTIPPEAYYCGSGSGTSGKIKGLKNGVRYSIAVAGVDGVGNVGKLSNVTCATPSPVDDFFKVYRDAGGQAGGGFCTATGGVGHGAGVSGLLLIALAALGGTLRRRRGT